MFGDKVLWYTQNGDEEEVDAEEGEREGNGGKDEKEGWGTEEVKSVRHEEGVGGDERARKWREKDERRKRSRIRRR